MLIVHMKYFLCFKNLLLLFLLLSACIFLFHPGRFAVSYDFIDTSDILSHLVTVPSPENVTKPLCPVVAHMPNRSTHADAFSLNFNESEIRMGGRWKPLHCLAQHKIALIVPYRNRKKHLETFINYMHGFLQAQLIEYSIYVVEQTPKLAFNRGLLFNIGYSWALRYEQIPCFIFHDVDLLPENFGNIYGCTDLPRHMSCSVNTLRYHLPYGTLFGGVVAMLQAHFQMVNGFPNRYFGWGGEDDDLFIRIINKRMNIVRFAPDISRYYMMPHTKDSAPPENLEHLKYALINQERDGLNDYENYYYSITKRPLPLYMLITADLQLPESYEKMYLW